MSGRIPCRRYAAFSRRLLLYISDASQAACGSITSTGGTFLDLLEARSLDPPL